MSSFSSTAGGVGGVGDSKEPIRGASTNGVNSSSRLPSLSPPPTGPSSSTTSASKQGGHILNNSVASSSPSSSYRPGSLVVGGDSVGITINPLETASVRSASSGGNGNQVGFLLRHTFLFSPRPNFFFRPTKWPPCQKSPSSSLPAAAAAATATATAIIPALRNSTTPVRTKAEATATTTTPLPRPWVQRAQALVRCRHRPHTTIFPEQSGDFPAIFFP